MSARPGPNRTRVAVIGGGIAGLVAAFDLHRAGCSVAVYEASDRFGGKIWSSPVGDRMVDAGPDTFLARVPFGRELCEDLGIADQLTSPAAAVPAYIHRDGTLFPLPDGTMLGVPTDLDALAANGVISAAGVARAAQDLTLPATDLSGDISVGAYFRARLGDEVTDRLIDPMIGGINASSIDHLSLAAASPQIAAAAAQHRSIIEGLRQIRASVGATLGSAGANEPVFYGLPGGIATIIDALVDALGGADLRLNTPVSHLDDLAALDPQGQPPDHVIIAAPAPAAAALLAPIAADAAEQLGRIDYASVAQVTVEVPRDSVHPEPDSSGILFPRVDGTTITAATFFSTKWAHYAREHSVLIRMTSGRYLDRRALKLSDEDLIARLWGELGSVIELRADPIATRVHRWHNALPQYAPGHRDAVAAIRADLAAQDRSVHLVGAAFDGVGIPACINLARQTARRILETI